MDNALPHMLTESALEAATKSTTNQIADGGITKYMIYHGDHVWRME